MPINKWPEGERPREKLFHQGPASLSDAELLAIFLRTGRRGKSAVDVGRDLLMAFGGLRQLLNADYRQFCAQPGVGLVKWVQLQAALELGRRQLAQSLLRCDVLTSPQLTQTYLQSRLRDCKHEIFACLYLDNRHRVIHFQELFRGTINGAAVYPREVVTEALQHNAAAVIFAHNHPSGIAEPSQADIQLTRTLKQALALVEIRTLDHFVVGDGQTVSFAERGLL